MKKVISILLSFIFSFCMSPGAFTFATCESLFPDEILYEQTVVEDFEAESLPARVAASKAELSRITSERGASLGALSVVPTEQNSSAYIAFGGKSKIRHNFSVISTTTKLTFKIHTEKEDASFDIQTLHIISKETEDGWYHLSAEFINPPSITGKGFLEIVSEDKVAYALDEIMILPVLNSAVNKAGNLVSYSAFETEEEISKLSYYKTIVTLSLADGAPQSNGEHSLHVQANGKSWGNVAQDADLRVGRQYKVSFWAKAADDATTGLPIQLAIDRSRRTDPAAPLYAQSFDKNNPNIHNEWTKHEFIYQCTSATTDTCLTRIYIRVGTKATDVLDYYLDDLVIEEIPDSYEVDISAILKGDIFENSTITFTAQGYMNSVGAWYRLYAPYEDECVIVKSGYLKNGETAKYYAMEESTESYKVEYNAIDAWGLAGSTKTVYANKNNISNDEISRVSYDTSIWVDEMETLDATVEYQGGSVTREIFAALATYDTSGRMLSVDAKDTTVIPGKTQTMNLSAQNDSTAQNAKTILWDNTTIQPIRAPKEFEKTICDYMFFVDPVNGINSSTASGSFSEPYKTLSLGRSAVQRLVNKLDTNDNVNIMLVMMPGTYDVTQAQITMTTSNTPAADNIHISFISYKPDDAVISGGKKITGFNLYDKEKNIYRARVGTSVYSRQLYINGVRAIRARSKGGLENCVNLGIDGIGVTTTDTSLLNYNRITDLELVFFEHWTNPRFVVEKAYQDEETGLVTLELNETLWSSRMNGKNTVPTVPEYYENAYELLDEEGEFYLDRTNGYLYYKPRAHENLKTAEVIMPVAESLLTVTGTVDEPMKNLTFEGIHFKYSTWTAPSDAGYADGQNNGGKTATTSGFIPSAVTLTNIHNVNFYNCTFSKIGQTGIKMLEAIQNCDFVGNEIYDTSGGALMVGDTTWIHARAPQDEKYYLINVNVTDNYIHDISLEYRAGAAVTAAFPKDSNICHNEIFRTSYSSIHTGWGWGSKAESGTRNFKINNNYLHKVLFDKMYDGGAIYVLGHTGGSLENLNEMCGNYCYDIANKFGALYPDEGSSYWLLDNNVVDLTHHPVWYGRGNSPLEARWTHIHTGSINNIVYGDNNYTTTANHLNNGTDIQYQAPNLYNTANWPEEAREIIRTSGIRPEYHDNFDFGVQEVYFANEFKVNQGETIKFAWIPTTSKMVKYDTSNALVVFESLNPEIASIDADGNITGVASGTTTIQIKIYEKEMEHIYEGKVVVP